MSAENVIKFLKKDPKLSKIINDIGKYKIKITKNHYESLVDAIISQQLSGGAAKAIGQRFRKLYSSRFPKPIQVMKTSDFKLRGTGLSRMKIKYIKELSKKIESKELKLKSFSKFSDEEVISQLTKIKGIGRWTVAMFLIFSLARLDVLPVGDLGLKKGIQLLYALPEIPQEIEVENIAEKWKPYRTVATWYIWKSLKKFDVIG